jgi:hypothetical protein
MCGAQLTLQVLQWGGGVVSTAGAAVWGHVRYCRCCRLVQCVVLQLQQFGALCGTGDAACAAVCGAAAATWRQGKFSRWRVSLASRVAIEAEVVAGWVGDCSHRRFVSQQ